MGGFSLTSLIAAGALMGAVAFDVTVNAVQDWYQVMYADAFWANRVTDTPALRDLSQEEAQINALLGRPGIDMPDRAALTDNPLSLRNG